MSDQIKTRQQLLSEIAALQKAHDELERRVERRAAELVAANQQLAIFRQFAEASGQGFSMADLDGRLLYLNPALCRMLAIEKPEEYIGRHLSACYSEETNRRGREEIEPALKRAGHWEGELPLLSGQGEAIPTWHNSFVIRDERGNPLRLAVVITDITERKQAEEALRQSYDQLYTIYEGMVEGLVITDIESKRFRRVNSSFCRMLGYSEEELLAKSVPDLHPPEEVPNDLLRFQAAAEGRVSINENRPVLRKDGKLFYADISGHRVMYEGRPCLLALFRDVTERRQAQAARERERRTLEHMLRASDHERQLIAYDIHDGLAQYLTGAIMQFQMSEHCRAPEPLQAGTAFEAGMAMLRQSHAEARRLISGVRPPILDESGVMAAISHMIHDPAFDQGPKIDFRSRIQFSRLPAVVENVIYRIVQEALSNARRHSKSESILVNLVQRGNRLRIEIRDWGLGFDPLQAKPDRFGLDGIRQRARLLGGKCRIHSRPGAGTAVIVELPITPRRQRT